MAHTVGKGGRHRSLPMSPTTLKAVDRYLRARRSHSSAKSQELWLGRRGPLTYSGLRQMLLRRSAISCLMEPGESSHAETHVRSRLFELGWERNRSDAPRRLAVPRNGLPLCSQYRRRAGPRGAQEVLTRRAVVVSAPLSDQTKQKLRDLGVDPDQVIAGKTARIFCKANDERRRSMDPRRGVAPWPRTVSRMERLSQCDPPLIDHNQPRLFRRPRLLLHGTVRRVN